MQPSPPFLTLGFTVLLGLTVVAGSPQTSQADSSVPSQAEPVASSGAEGDVWNFTLTNDLDRQITVKWLDAQANEMQSYGGASTEADPWIGPGEAWRVEGGAHTAESHWFAIHTQADGFLCSFSPREGAVVQLSQLSACNSAPPPVAGTGGATARFTDNGNGTVTDSKTGLTWLKDASCADLQAVNEEGRAANRAAATQAASSLRDGMCGLSDGSQAGDWRLPTAADFCKGWGQRNTQGGCDDEDGLINSRFRSPALSNGQGDAQWTEGDPFLGVPSRTRDHYYTSSKAVGAGNSCLVFINQGDMYFSSDMIPSGHVWPVR